MDPGEPRVQDIVNGARVSVKCRIPQKLPPVRQKPLNKPKLSVNSKPVVSAPQSRFPSMASSRPLSGEQARPKTANRTKDDTMPPKLHGCLGTWPAGRSEKEKSPSLKVQKPSVIPKRITNEPTVSKMSPFITVPITQKQPTKTLYTNRTLTCLPDQETINRHEDLELHQSEGVSSPGTDLNDEESITLETDSITQLKMTWQEKTKQFEKMKHELKDRQKTLMVTYAALGMMHQKMSVLGQHVSLPPTEELCLMNLGNLTSNQLLQLCANALHSNERELEDSASTTLVIDMNKLYNMPSKLVGTCEETLVKRKEIINTLVAMTTKKDISLNQLLKKINEFNTENEMLACSLEKVKSEFFEDLGEIVAYIKECAENVRATQLHNKQLANQISELNAEKDDPRKQTHNSDFKPNVHNKSRLEELEKQLKEEKSKRSLLRDRLTRAEGQAKTNAEQASQLEATLEQSRSKNWNLERTVQQLRDQNQKLQDDLDKELRKFTESIRENTARLEEIAEAREKLQSEKEELEKNLTELSTTYTESLKKSKQEMNNKVVHLIEMEKRLEDEKESKRKLENKVESLCSQLLESQLRHKDTCKQMQDKESQLSKAVECYRELEIAKHNLAESNKEMDDYRNRLTEQSVAIREIEHNFKEASNLEKDLRNDLDNKNEYIRELEKKIALLEKQLKESKNEMMLYNEELRIFKTHIAQFQEDYGEYENLNELKEMINKQRDKLLEVTRQNSELAEALQQKDFELERHVEQITEQENIIEQRDDFIKMLSVKEEEHTNIIKLLRNNIEMRTQADIDINQQLSEKNGEIESLITNIETRKQQISNLEKMILTLEDQTRKASTQRRKDQEKIIILESKVAEYETYNLERKRSLEDPQNLDNIIKILEDELGASLDTKPNQTQLSHYAKKNYARDRVKYSKPEKYDGHEGSSRLPTYEGHEKFIAKIKTDNYSGKKTYNQPNVDRKQAKTSIDAQTHLVLDPGEKVYNVPPPTHENVISKRKIQSHLKDAIQTRNLNMLAAPVQFRENKKSKMYKSACHRLL